MLFPTLWKGQRMGIAEVFKPVFEGTYKPTQLHPQILEAFASRISGPGLFPGASSQRNRYELTEAAPTRLSFQSANLGTGINVGLNEVELTMDPEREEISFRVRYWTWTRYCLFLSGAISLFLAAFVCVPLQASDALPEGAAGGWVLFGIVLMLLFWGMLWPWMLVALHKKPAKRCLLRLLDEVQAGLTGVPVDGSNGQDHNASPM